MHFNDSVGLMYRQSLLEQVHWSTDAIVPIFYEPIAWLFRFLLLAHFFRLLVFVSFHNLTISIFVIQHFCHRSFVHFLSHLYRVWSCSNLLFIFFCFLFLLSSFVFHAFVFSKYHKTFYQHNLLSVFFPSPVHSELYLRVNKRIYLY